MRDVLSVPLFFLKANPCHFQPFTLSKPFRFLRSTLRGFIGTDYMKTYHIYTFDTPRSATMLRWGTHPVPDCTMIPGEYVRLGKRTWAVWLGSAPSSKYIYHVPKHQKTQ
jgi:hypothetical protein